MKHPLYRIILALTVLVVLSYPGYRTTSAQSATYSITDLGTLPGGNYSYANSLNNSGQVVGLATTANGAFHAFLWQNGIMTDLGTLGGFNSQAADINDVGQVTGLSDTLGGSEHVFLYNNGVMQDLNVPASGFSLKVGMNDSAQLVSQLPNGHGFLYNNGVTQDLGTFGGQFSQASGINNSGSVVGYADVSSGVHHTFLYNGTMQDLGLLAGSYQSIANEINDNGQVVGYFCLDGGCNSQHGALWQKDVNGNYIAYDLGTLPGEVFSNAASINKTGEIVGGSYPAGADNATGHGFVYDSAHGMQNLNNLVPAGSGWNIGAALGINDSGQIVGVGTINGQTHGYLLTPASDTVPPTISNASASPSVLWPPNHKMRDVTVNYIATDNSGSVTCTLSVTSNEGTPADWQIVDAHHVRLRAERAGTGNGRIYTILITCTDSNHNSSTQPVIVTVPHDQR